MNSIYLILISGLIFALGYRFYAKFLGLTAFDTEPGRATPAQGMTADPDAAPAHGIIVFGQHFAAIAGAGTLPGVIVALIWGWIPAFLWIVTGAVVAAGTYGMASLWLAIRHGGDSPGTITAALMGGRAGILIRVLSAFVLITLIAFIVLVVARLLARHPDVVLAVILQIPVALMLGRYLRGGAVSGVWLSLAAGLVFCVIVLPVAHIVPLQFDGVLALRAAGRAGLTVDATTLWVVLVLVYGFFALRAPLARLTQPRGFLGSIVALLILLLMLTAIAIGHPPMSAPTFNPDAAAPRTIPWIFIIATGAALGGFHALVATGTTVRQLASEAALRPVGYGAALLNGLLGIAVLVVCGSGYADGLAWQSVYPSFTAVMGLDHMLDNLINGFARLLGQIGLTPSRSADLGALLFVSLGLATIETGLRILKMMLGEIGRISALPALQSPRALRWLAVGLPATILLLDGHGRGGLALWPLFGSANQILAAAMFAVAALYLLRRGRPILAVLTPAAIMGGVVIWALFSQLRSGWTQSAWLVAVGAGSLLGIAIWLLVEYILAHRNAPRPTPRPQQKPLF